MADEYHIIIESPKSGTLTQCAYMSTHADLAARGWKKTDTVERIHALAEFLTKGDIVDETDRVVYEDFAVWKAAGEDAYVSVAAYPATKRVRVSDPGSY